ncbi:MAG: N-(5'-phosphoribosyl)anthranilate isomerase [Bacteroidetes bacterium]|nr:N-(5'-phosphoribosyl)anthranilate isomerase [Bacteroidota bacterium]
MQKTKVKASAVMNLTDARYFAAREVEWLGFPFGGGPEGAISPMVAKAIIEWVDGVKIVGEFGFPTAEELEEMNSLLHFDAVQVGMFTPLEELAKLPGITFIKEVVLEKSSSEDDLAGHFRRYAACCDYFLLDFSKAGIAWTDLQSGIPVSLVFLKQLFGKYKVFLALDFQPDEMDQVLETLKPHGLGLSGGGEEKTGFKSFDELDEIFDKLEVAEHQ